MSDEEIDFADEALDFNFSLEIIDQSAFIDNPGIPFFYEFKYPLGLRSDLIIEGTVNNDADRFAIDLCQTTPQGKDIVFHFCPRLNLNYVARNSYIKGGWGKEESHSITKSPFKKGEKFTIEMFLVTNSFLVSVNSSHFCGFNHRATPLGIDAVEIYGDINLDKVELSTREKYPLFYEPDKQYVGKQIITASKTFWLLPLTYKFQENLKIGTTLEIFGRIKLLPHCLFINLQLGAQIYPEPMIPYHASFRWNPKKEDTVVLNSWTGKWDEEIVTPMNLMVCPGSNFKMKIVAEKDGFSTEIDGVPLPKFPHRMNSALVNTLYFQGDAEIYDIKTSIQ